MTMAQIDYFVAAAKYGSFSEAANKLYVSQPAISKQIQALEKELGVTLFQRKYRSVILTAPGEMIFEQIKLMQLSFQATLERARFLEKSRFAHVFNIGLFEAASLGNLSAIISTFSKSHSDLSLTLEQRNFSSLLTGLASKKFDLVITLEHMIRDKANVNTQTLIHARHVGYLSKEHPLASNPNISFADLKSECFYVPAMEGDTLTKDHCTYICISHGFSPREIRIVPNVESVMLALRMGLGAAVLDDRVSIKNISDFIAVPTNIFSPVVFAWMKENENPLIPMVIDEILSHFDQTVYE